MSSEIEIETVPGLPHDLPPGEHIVWQGRPQWKAMARQTFKVRWIGAYFAVFASARFVAAMPEGLPGAMHLLTVAALAAVCLAVLCMFAWAYARTTVYTITSRRIVMRIGVALPTTWNLPFKRLASADLTLRTELDGDIALQLKSGDRIAWLQLWPHVAPWQFVRARPSLRNIVEPEAVAMLLADAVQAWAATEGAPVLVTALEPSAPVVTVVSPAPAEVRLNAGVATEAGQ